MTEPDDVHLMHGPTPSSFSGYCSLEVLREALAAATDVLAGAMTMPQAVHAGWTCGFRNAVSQLWRATCRAADLLGFRAPVRFGRRRRCSSRTPSFRAVSSFPRC